MEEKSAQVEQITAPVEATDEASKPSPPFSNVDDVPKRGRVKKDPKKVAAGKALARKNKEAREAKLKLDGIQQVEARSQPSSPFDTFRNASILVGSALVLYHGYQAVKRLLPFKTSDTRDESPIEENSIQME